MYFLAGSVFLMALMAFARGETCGQVMQCLDHAQGIKAAAETGDINAMCDTQKKMVDCFSSALDDCQKSGSSFPKATLDQFQTSMANARKQYETACSGRGSGSSSGSNTGSDGGKDGMKYGGSDTGIDGSSDSIPEKVSCSESNKCVFDISKLQSALNNNQIKEACAVLGPSAKCMKSALEDCRDKGILPEQQLNDMASQADEVDALSSEHCGGASGIGVSAVFMTMISALAFIVVRLF